MPYDEKLADRVRAIVGKDRRVTEKHMFGGVAWMLDGNMFVGVSKNELMVRVGPEAHEDAIRQPHARNMDFTGRPMRGYVFVAPQGFAADDALGAWIARATEFTGTLPPKKPKRKTR